MKPDLCELHRLIDDFQDRYPWVIVQIHIRYDGVVVRVRSRETGTKVDRMIGLAAILESPSDLLHREIILAIEELNSVV